MSMKGIPGIIGFLMVFLLVLGHEGTYSSKARQIEKQIVCYHCMEAKTPDCGEPLNPTDKVGLEWCPSKAGNPNDGCIKRNPFRKPSYIERSCGSARACFEYSQTIGPCRYCNTDYCNGDFNDLNPSQQPSMKNGPIFFLTSVMVTVLVIKYLYVK